MLEMLLSADSITSLLASTVRMLTPILLAALGEIYTQRSGILNLGTEGTMLMGALGGFLGVYFTGSLFGGVVLAIIFGMIFGSIMGFLSITMKANQVIAGTAMTILGTGLAAFIFRTIFGIQKLPPQVKSFQPMDIPFLSSIPILGKGLFSHNALVYIAIILVFVTWIVLEKTTLGLKIKAVGEHPRAADSKGISVAGIRYTSIIIGGAYQGLAGAFLSIGFMNTYTDSLISGRGFIAIAVVIFSRWNPFIAFGGAAIFGFASSLQMRLQAMGSSIPNQFLLMLPYLLTIIALISVSKKAEFPSAYTVPYSRMER